MKSQFLIAAPMSGSGKTTVARGLMALLRSRGYRVQPFKCGPDYIDTKFHEAVCGRPSVNLDTFMATDDHVRRLFHSYGEDADVCVVEGMMGLFDGYDRDHGSSAEVARVLGLPVVLVVDARSAAYSMAPLLQGFVGFRPDVHIMGIIFNKVGSDRHAQMLHQVCDDLHLPCLGCLPKHPALETASRYLGLDFSEAADAQPLLHLLDTHVDWRSIVGEAIPADAPARPLVACKARTRSLSKLCSPEPDGKAWKLHLPSEPSGKGNVLVARNAESFSFIYQETLDRFQTVRLFDPETDVPTFDGIDLLYLPGGYPEKHLPALAANGACLQAIRDYADRGGRIVAECGGMMYLCRTIVTDDGEWSLCGVLPYDITARNADCKLSLGYRRFMLGGHEYRGHEFHYTRFLGEQPPSVAQVLNAKGEPTTTPIMRRGNVLASYTHLYWGDIDIDELFRPL